MNKLKEERFLKMNRLNVFLLILLCVLYFSTIAYAEQDKYLVKKCIWSFEDSAIPSFTAWDDATGRGVIFLYISPRRKRR